MKECWFNGNRKGCTNVAKSALPVGHDLRWFCTPCYDAMCALLKSWLRGEDTDLRQLRASAYQRRHPELDV